MATSNKVTPNDNQIKSLLNAEKRLTGYINELEQRPASEIVPGALSHLRDAENEMMNRRAKLEAKAPAVGTQAKDGGR